MESDGKPTPPPPPGTSGFSAKSMAALGDSLTELIDAMEAEVAVRGTISHENANRLRALLARAEEIFSSARSINIRH